MSDLSDIAASPAEREEEPRPLAAPDETWPHYLYARPDESRDEIERRMVDVNVEVGAIFSPMGHLKWLPKIGNHRTIPWCERELESMLDADMTHSHLDYGTFSEGDLATLTRRDGRSLRAVVVRNRRIEAVYEMMRPEGGWGSREEDVVAYVAKKLGCSTEDVLADLASVQAMPEYPAIVRRATILRIFGEAERAARQLLHRHHKVLELSKWQREDLIERYLHHQLAQMFRDAGVGYRKETKDVA